MWTVLMVLGLLSAGLGALLGIGFAIPALGLNSHGRNSVEFTLAAEGVAAVLYLVGAGLVIIGGRLMAERQPRPAKSLLPVLASVFLGLMVGVAGAIQYRSWQLMFETLIFVGVISAVFLTVAIGSHARERSR